MDSEVVKAFNAELVSLYELRPPISKKKIVDITKAAMKAIKYYKHVVFGAEKFLIKCKPEYKIPGFYCIDSIIRQSRHQFKDRDVFAPRFAVNMHSTISNVLNCKAEDKLKVVRVLNLWKSHEIYDGAKLRPWLDFCHDVHGLEIDFIQVEKCVKGEQADFSIYSRVPGRGEKRKAESLSPRPFHDNQPHTPPLPENEPSDIAVDGGVSERETLAMLATMGLDLGGMFSSDSALLQKVHKIVNDKLVERRESDSKRQGNIKNLLSREFDYSDEEDSCEEDIEKNMEVETKSTELTKQQIMGMAEAVLREQDTKEEIQRMHTERISALTQAAAARVQAVKHQQNALASPSAFSSTVAPTALQNYANVPPIPIPLNPVREPPASLIMPVPPVSPLITQSLNTKTIISPTAAQQLLMGAAASGVIPPFTPNMPPPSFMNMLQTSQLPPNFIQAATSHSRQSQRTTDSDNRLERDQDDRIQTKDDNYNRDRDDRGRRDRGSGDQRRDHPRFDNRVFDDGRASKRIKRSRSRDRTVPGPREHRRSSSHGRRASSRGGGDRERPERDRNDPEFREMERQRRKMGLPWPPKEGHVLIASCTLWLGRIPTSCSESDIRMSVSDIGEPIRVSIIHSRACAYVTMKDRRSAYRVIDRMQRNFEVARKYVKLSWGIGQGLKGEKYSQFWDVSRGISLIPYNKLPDDLVPLLDGGHLEVESLPSNLANMYDEHGLKGKSVVENPADINMPSDLQVPQLPGVMQFPFPLGHPPRLPGAVPFLPPGLLSMPGFYPPVGMPPHGSMSLSEVQSPLIPEKGRVPSSTTPPNVAGISQQGTAPGKVGPRMGDRGFEPPGSNYPSPPFTNPSMYQTRMHFPRNAPVGGIRGNIPSPRGQFNAQFRARSPFGVPRPRNLSMIPPPSHPPPMFPPCAPPGFTGNFYGMRSNGPNNSGTQNSSIIAGNYAAGEKTKDNELVHSSAALTIIHDEPIPGNGGRELLVEDSGNEPVTSTTHDDETIDPSSLSAEITSPAAGNSDDLKAVTLAEDRMLHNAIIYETNEEYEEGQ